MKLHSVYGQLLFDRKLTKSFKQVKANKGAGGIDGETIESYEANLEGNILNLLGRLRNKEYKPSQSGVFIFRRKMERRDHWEFRRLKTVLFNRA